jgi:hypothetical protein
LDPGHGGDRVGQAIGVLADHADDLAAVGAVHVDPQALVLDERYEVGLLPQRAVAL